MQLFENRKPFTLLMVCGFSFYQKNKFVINYLLLVFILLKKHSEILKKVR